MPHPSSPFIIAGLVAAACFTWAGSLAFDASPYAPAPGAVLAVSLAGLAVVCGAGILIARARWSRPLAIGLSAAALALGIITPLHPASAAGILIGGLALAAAAGPWLRTWLRRLPSADGPSPAGVAAIFGLLVLPAYAATARPDGFGVADWIVVVVAPLLAWGLSRARPTALWAARIGLPVPGIAAAVTDDLPSGLAVAAGCIGAAALAWRRDLLVAVSPLIERRDPVPFPPELVSPELLSTAGFDDHGRPLEGG